MCQYFYWFFIECDLIQRTSQFGKGFYRKCTTSSLNRRREIFENYYRSWKDYWNILGTLEVSNKRNRKAYQIMFIWKKNWIWIRSTSIRISVKIYDRFGRSQEIIIFCWIRWKLRRKILSLHMRTRWKMKIKTNITKITSFSMRM